MNKTKLVLLKRAIFWFEVISTFLILCLGIFLTIKLLSGANNLHEAMIGLFQFSGYLLKLAVKGMRQSPEIIALSLLWISLYIASLYFFAQTETEKKLIKYTLLASLFAVWTSSIGIFGNVMAALASQGAGH